MPNGGSDCCMTCWFNRRNRGSRNWSEHADPTVPAYCEIRDVAIDEPGWRYCANHPHRRPDRDPIPIGPITHYDDGYDGSKTRSVWKHSPDTEQIRQHLINLLAEMNEHMAHDWYPIGAGLAETVIWQLGEFKEQRAVPELKRIRDHYWGLADAARDALTKIQEAN